MPTYLRNFYLKKLSDFKKKESEEIEKSTKGKSQATPRVNIPRFKR